MARITALCFLLLTTLLNDVTSFTINKRHSRSTDLADALRMLERQRRRISKEDNFVAGSSPRLLEERPLGLADLESWFNAPQRINGPSEDDINAAWLAKTLGLEDYGGLEGLPREAFYPQPPPQEQESPVQVQPTDQELDAIFGEKTAQGRDTSDESDVGASPTALKKDKEVMTDMKGDAKQDAAPVTQTRSDVIEEKTSQTSDDVTLTKAEFKALLKAVEKLQKQAINSAERDIEEAEEVEDAIQQKVSEAREEAKEELEEAEAKEEEEEEEEEERKKEEEGEEEGEQVPDAQPVSKEELDNLFGDQTEEVITTDNGKIVKTDKTLRDPEGKPVGKEETVQEVETVPGEQGDDKTSLNSIENFWYLKNYLEQDGDRKKRNSKRSYIPTSLSKEFATEPEALTSPDSAELIAAYVNQINQLQSELDQTKLESYLEDVENDILTDALNQATLAQVRGHVSPDELASLQDAIRVEEALQKVKASRLHSSQDIAVPEALLAAMSNDVEDLGDNEKRGEPWKKRDDVIEPEIPVYLTGDADDVMQEEENEEEEEKEEKEEEEKEEENAALALAQQQVASLDDVLPLSRQKFVLEGDRGDDDLFQVADSFPIASLFSKKADHCPAVRDFSTNCQFAGDSIDFEARALCNVHEMCYVCGHTLGVEQSQCDYIYLAASKMLCQTDEDCVMEAGVFLNTMKLKHRFVPYSQRVCRSRCAAQFLSII